MKRTPTNTRVIELTIPKKESKWWPRLMKEKEKVRVYFPSWAFCLIKLDDQAKATNLSFASKHDRCNSPSNSSAKLISKI
ncbi:unnamed protein product [Cylicostephanus goldi]|uniref:CS domain-containing protein n=1 Tax=Cylicostephanus goldi TaxID=71465 RepID=A0A3P6Q6Z7_CYLGO|nr:unnamed protein product [Cylicostephanus goldi]